VIRFEVGSSSDTGRARTSNEDAMHVSDRLFVVADGMGGHVGGEIASHLAVERCEAGPESWTTDALVALVQDANARIVERAEVEPDLHGMGTTVTMVARLEPTDEYPDERLLVANVGDSRTYVFDGEALQQLTDDHTLVQRLVRSGALTPEQAATHPQRNVVTRALGIGDEILVDTWEVRVFTGDRFLLCSDGLSGELDDEQIAAVLRRLASPQEAADELVRLANEAGGHDNITVIVVDVEVPDERPEDSTGEHDRIVVEASAATRPEEDVLDGVVVDDADDEVDLDAIEALKEATRAAEAALGHGAATSQEHEADAPETSAERPRRLTWRVAAFVLALLVVAALAAAAITWSARNTFSVVLEDGEVVILRGRPEGVLWIEPTLEETTGIPEADVPERFLRDLTDGKSFSSLERARLYIRNIELEIDDLAGSSSLLPSDATTTSAGP
jgi:protein phosphatase